MGDTKTLHELLSSTDSRFLYDYRTFGDLSPEEALEARSIMQRKVLSAIEDVKRVTAKVQQELAKQRNNASESGTKKNDSITVNKIEGGVRSEGGAFTYNPLK